MPHASEEILEHFLCQNFLNLVVSELMKNFDLVLNLLSLKSIPGIGSITLKEIYKNYGVILKNKITKNDWNDIFLNTKFKNNFLDYKKGLGEAQEIIKKCVKNNIGILTIYDHNYPVNLSEIPDAPAILFYKGFLQVDKFKNTVAIVGTRKFTDYGKNACEKYTHYIVERGFSIVSGLALGIDVISHDYAAGRDGYCIAVLGSGVDMPYPVTNTRIYNKILDKGGVIFSEYNPGTLPRPEYFPMRNRIIAGLSKKTLVIEAAEKSGSIITAKLAFDYNREVYALPADITRLNSQGCNQIIKDNIAKLTFKPSDLFDDDRSDFTRFQEMLSKYDNSYEPIIKIISSEQMSTDEIAIRLNIDIIELNSKLTDLEIDGCIARMGEKWILK